MPYAATPFKLVNDPPTTTEAPSGVMAIVQT